MDLTIDDTRSRVVGSLRAVAPPIEGPDGDDLDEAIGQWRLLVDLRILARAGTPTFVWPRNDVVAAINFARFIAKPFSPQTELREELLFRTVATALSMLDGVRAVAGDADIQRASPRLGIVGLADALAMLGHDYASSAGRACAAGLMRKFACAALAASIRLARDRGARDDGWRATALARACERMPGEALLRDVREYGLRFGALTALMPLPSLALFADNVADAADPLRGERHVHRIPLGGGVREIAASGFALTLWRRFAAGAAGTFPSATAADVSAADLAAMRAIVEPWFDHCSAKHDEPATC